MVAALDALALAVGGLRPGQAEGRTGCRLSLGTFCSTRLRCHMMDQGDCAPRPRKLCSVLFLIL